MYPISPITVPQNKREEINNKILHIVENNLTEKYNITAADVYNTYTGNGSLHGLTFNDYDSFHAYSEAKKQIENGQFFTPHYISKFIVDCLKPSSHDIIADLTCGAGSFFNWLPNQSNVYGCELDIKAFKIAKFLYPEAHITADDIRNYQPNTTFDTILGNPPFSLRWHIGKDEYLSQLYYCIKAYELLKPCGILALIVPSSFLADDFTDSGMIKRIDQMYNFIYHVELPSDSFKSGGVDSFRTKIMFFQKKSEHIAADQPYSTSIKHITALDQANSDTIYKQYT